jgi:polysaccharide export outer membrane protein
MRVAVHRITAIILVIIGCGLLLAQVPEAPKTKPEETENKQELGPAAAQTQDEIEKELKAPGPVSMPTSAPIDPKSYVIGPEDILAIRVWREPELSQGVQVRPDGKITLPLIGELQAAGLTPEDLKDNIVKALQEFINKPEVMVMVQAVLSRKYYITGEVNRTGPFPLVVPITILEALTNAGGFREFANTKKITVLRKGKILKFNYNDVIKGKNMDQNVLVEPGDYIVVP